MGTVSNGKVELGMCCTCSMYVAWRYHNGKRHKRRREHVNEHGFALNGAPIISRTYQVCTGIVSQKTRKPWLFPHRAMPTDQSALGGCVPVAIPGIDGGRRGNENLGGFSVSVRAGEV